MRSLPLRRFGSLLPHLAADPSSSRGSCGWAARSHNAILWALRPPRGAPPGIKGGAPSPRPLLPLPAAFIPVPQLSRKLLRPQRGVATHRRSLPASPVGRANGFTRDPRSAAAANPFPVARAPAPLRSDRLRGASDGDRNGSSGGLCCLNGEGEKSPACGGAGFRCWLSIFQN